MKQTKTKLTAFEKSPTELTIETITKCCRVALNGYAKSMITFRVDESVKSNSKYIKLIKEDTFYTIRVSDHRTEIKYWDKQIIIRKGVTKNKIVIATIRNGIEILQHKRIDHVIGQVGYDTSV